MTAFVLGTVMVLCVWKVIALSRTLGQEVRLLLWWLVVLGALGASVMQTIKGHFALQMYRFDSCCPSIWITDEKTWKSRSSP